MSMNNAKNVGFRKGVIFNFGVFTGFFIGIIVCFLASSVLYNIVPKIQLPMKILGAAYMIFLMVTTLLPPKEHEIKSNNGSFIIGILSQLVNPAGVFFGLTLTSSYVLPYYQAIPTLLLFSFLIAFIGFTGSLCWSLFGSLFSTLFIRHRKVLNIIMSVLLLYCAVSLFL
jgi:threonine/homoserine/homoserine lactone efflux protein